MSLPPLSPDNTARFKIFYTTVGHQHVATIRNGTASPSSLGAQWDVLMTALSPDLYATVIDKVEYAPSGSNVFNPVVTGIEGNTYGSGAGSVSVVPFFVGFVGRSTGGRKVRFEVYGMNNLGVNFRFSPGEDAAVDGAILVPQASSNTFYAIDGIKPTWYSYANAKSSAYWQRKVR